jgi:hypothetical protein
MTRREIPCPHCERSFSTHEARWMHLRAKHSQEAIAQYRAPQRRKRPETTGEPSIASQLVDAQLDAAMGKRPPEWLESMFPDAFEEAP